MKVTVEFFFLMPLPNILFLQPLPPITHFPSPLSPEMFSWKAMKDCV